MHYKVVHEAFGTEFRGRLLAYALSNESRFEKTGLGTEHEVDETVRVSRKLTDLGPHLAALEQKIGDLVPELTRFLGLAVCDEIEFEFEMVAHGHGAFYRRHIDTYTGHERSGATSDRLLSVVYYFFREPKRFEGGALRIFPNSHLCGALLQEQIDIPIEQDMLLAFSSWEPHEVLPVSCPSREFRDSRFAINCWILRPRKNTVVRVCDD